MVIAELTVRMKALPLGIAIGLLIGLSIALSNAVSSAVVGPSAPSLQHGAGTSGLPLPSSDGIGPEVRLTPTPVPPTRPARCPPRYFVIFPTGGFTTNRLRMLLRGTLLANFLNRTAVWKVPKKTFDVEMDAFNFSRVFDHYCVMSYEELLELPVSERAEGKCLDDAISCEAYFSHIWNRRSFSPIAELPTFATPSVELSLQNEWGSVPVLMAAHCLHVHRSQFQRRETRSRNVVPCQP